MARTVVYPALEPALPAGADAVGGGGLSDDTTPADTYREKIVKYIPAEVLAIVVLLATSSTNVGDWAVWVVAILGLVFTPIYLWNSAKKENEADRPRFHFFVLASIAYIAWLLGTSDATREVTSVPDATGEWILGLAAFVIPGIDELLTKQKKA
jgi:hypothetical protein